MMRLCAWSASSLPSGASAALSAARSPPRALSSRSSLCTYSWLGLGLRCPGRLLEPLHTPGKVRNRRALLSAIASTTQRACESRRAYSARCVRLVSAPHAALCDSLKLDTSRYLVHNIVHHSPCGLMS